ncbi:DUF5133 domain-containing protein [Streptomyces sp. CS113]|uniref:DUF5133 domain-containing protein n=1 Tax=Streptomyces sp. CS113 TaxID=1982761 RepID=UPI000B4078F8|nr:DUF5133 domain-containing protein [Streptomyces sp. CS113]OVZ99704.1 DUF5133 domain-containing protein [Streptomyces sp. CS113]
MLMPHPAVLRGLLAEYEAAAVDEPVDATGRPGPRTRDLAYTLCVSTGTRDVRRALEAARRHLADAPVTPPAPVAGGAHAGVAD